MHESQRAAARSLGLSAGQTMRSVVLPQAVRRVVPPLMNDFVSLQKDVALICVLGPVEALRRATIIKDRIFNFTPVRRRRRAVPLRVDPADPAHRPPARPRAPADVGHGGRDDARSRCAASSRSSATHRVLDGIDLDVGRADRSIALIGASGSGKSTLLRCINLLEPIDDGDILLDGVDISEPGLDPDPIRRRIGMVFQSFNLFPHLTRRSTTSRWRRASCGARHGAERHARAMQLLDRLGLGRQGRRLPRPAVGRPAAARRHRPLAGDGPRGDAARRDHLGARPRARRRGARRRPRPARQRDDDGASPPTRWASPARSPTASASSTPAASSSPARPSRCSAHRDEERTRTFLTRVIEAGRL